MVATTKKPKKLSPKKLVTPMLSVVARLLTLVYVSISPLVFQG